MSDKSEWASRRGRGRTTLSTDRIVRKAPTLYHVDAKPEHPLGVAAQLRRARVDEMGEDTTGYRRPTRTLKGVRLG